MTYLRLPSERLRLLAQSFQAKLLLTLLLPLLVIWSVGIFTSKDMLERQQKFVGDQQVSTAKRLADELNEKIRDRFSILEAIAANLDVAQLTGTHDARNYLAQRYALRPLFMAGTVIYDRKGAALGDFPVVEGREGSNFAEREYLQRLFATGKPTISQPYVGRFLKVTQISMCVPIARADRQVTGALCGNFDLHSANFLGLLSNPQAMGDNGFFLISTSNRLLIASTDSSRVMSQLPDNALVQQLVAGGEMEVDDSEINREVAQRIFVGEGAQVALANDGRAALEWLQANSDQVDIVLMDVQMPVLNGYDATRQIRRMPAFAALSIVALTAGAFKKFLRLFARNYADVVFDLRQLDRPAALVRLLDALLPPGRMAPIRAALNSYDFPGGEALTLALMESPNTLAGGV